MRSNPKAWAAVEKEYNGLRDIGTWDESTVREWSFGPDSVKAEAARTKQEHHVGRLFPIATEKHSELPEKDRIMKGRIVYQGDNIQDTDGRLINLINCFMNKKLISSAGTVRFLFPITLSQIYEMRGHAVRQ